MRWLLTLNLIEHDTHIRVSNFIQSFHTDKSFTVSLSFDPGTTQRHFPDIRLLLPVLLIIVDETSRLYDVCHVEKVWFSLVCVNAYRAVVTLDICRPIELCEDVLCEHLAQFDTHLI